MSPFQNTKGGGVKRTLLLRSLFGPSPVDESGSFHSFFFRPVSGMRDTAVERLARRPTPRPELGNRPTKIEHYRQTA